VSASATEAAMARNVDLGESRIPASEGMTAEPAEAAMGFNDGPGESSESAGLAAETEAAVAFHDGFTEVLIPEIPGMDAETAAAMACNDGLGQACNDSFGEAPAAFTAFPVAVKSFGSASSATMGRESDAKALSAWNVTGSGL